LAVTAGVLLHGRVDQEALVVGVADAVGFAVVGATVGGATTGGFGATTGGVGATVVLLLLVLPGRVTFALGGVHLWWPLVCFFLQTFSV
jgi:hypothetical protein